MTRVGVVTFHRASNYGAVLQAYALQEALKGLGCDAEVVDYRSDFIEKHYASSVRDTVLNPKKLAIAILKNGYMRNRRGVFDGFRSQHLPMSPPADGRSLPEALARYDLVITGSDQVWNTQTSGFDRNYFLAATGVNARKAAYAASIGMESVPVEYQDEYQDLLSDFEVITVREETAASALAPILGFKPRTVLDPTLLLSRDEWHDRLGQASDRSPYILMYLLAETTSVLNYARRLSRHTGMEIRYVTQRLFRPRGMTILDSLDPAGFVQEFQGASAVVTNSFHGIAFALNFGLNLHYDLLPASSPVNSRITDLTRAFNMEGRLIGSALLPDRDGSSISASQVQLAKERERSRGILADMVADR